jgi:ubiquitin carboxyl-terminal hydrolase 48
MAPAKRLLPEAVTPQVAQELLRQKAQHGAFTEQDLMRIMRLDQPACTGCKSGNRKDNPNCLCGLVPPPGSFRKKGLWMKEPAALTQIGPDPNLYKRQVRRWRRGPGMGAEGSDCAPCAA